MARAAKDQAAIEQWRLRSADGVEEMEAVTPTCRLASRLNRGPEDTSWSLRQLLRASPLKGAIFQVVVGDLLSESRHFNLSHCGDCTLFETTFFFLTHVHVFLLQTEMGDFFLFFFSVERV